jgi:hypothetical protein
VHLNDPAAVKRVRTYLTCADRPVLVEFCARGSRFTLCLFSTSMACRLGRPDGENGHTYVGLWTMGSHGGFYSFHLEGYITAGYVMEKLRIKNETDAQHIAVFLMALGQEDVEGYLATHVKLSPGRDYLDDRAHQEI